MRIAVVGGGYVGLVSGACFAEFGNEVAVVEVDAPKLAELQAGRLPIYEPGLDKLVADNVAAGRLSFGADLAFAVKGAEAVFIAVGTPSRRGDGHADLTYVFAAVEEVARVLERPVVIVTKSTVPVGTGRKVADILHRLRPDLDVHVASNPEFLREGNAIGDFMRPDRVVIGCETELARETLARVYQPLEAVQATILFTGIETAELIKYAGNSFLAMKVTFINEMADLCERVGADIHDVSRGIGLDERIGHRFLQPGPGFGGSCFPKDTLALTRIAQDAGAPTRLVETVVSVNDARKAGLAKRIIAAAGGSVRGKTVALFGLTFKAETDDMRDSPSLPIADRLVGDGAVVHAYDPEGMGQARPLLPKAVHLFPVGTGRGAGRRRAGGGDRMGGVPRDHAGRPRGRDGGPGGGGSAQPLRRRGDAESGDRLPLHRTQAGSGLSRLSFSSTTRHAALQQTRSIMRLPLLALAVASFGIGTTEFIIMGLLPDVAASFDVSIPRAGLLVTGYALAVTIGAPIVAILTAKLPRRRTLVLLMGIFIVGNALCALAASYWLLMAARVVTALAHGAFFGIGSVVATQVVAPNRRAQAIALMFTGLTLANVLGVPFGTILGQAAGWRATFWAVSGIGVAAAAALIAWVPNVAVDRDIDLLREFSTLRRPQVLLAMLISMIASVSMFILFTYIAPLLEDVTGISAHGVSLVLLALGVGLTLGNLVGGRLADWRLMPAVMGLFVLLAVVLAAIHWAAPFPLAMIAALFVWAGVAFALVAPLQLRVVGEAVGAPNLASTLNQGAFNLGNATGAWLGGLVISAGFGYRALPLAASAAALVGLAVTVFAVWLERRDIRPVSHSLSERSLT